MPLRTGVIGHPVNHSLSPLIHTYWIKQHNINATYDTIDIAPDNFADGISRLIDRGFSGFNVTLPHKQTVMELCSIVDPVAQAIGAVNTVVIRDGRLHGYNTDAYGFIENLKQALPSPKRTIKSALVLGAGGAARAVIYALLAENVSEITLCNRTLANAEELANTAFCHGRVRILEWDHRVTKSLEVDLIVNTTSLGMAGSPPLDMDLSQARQRDCIVYDIVYRPLITGLLHQAQEQAMPIVTGSGMLLHQARPAFHAWFGILPEIDDLLIGKVEGAAQT